MSKYIVGVGLANAMKADGTEPATDGEFWPPAPKKAQLERAYAKNGTLYAYLFETNETHRFGPGQ